MVHRFDREYVAFPGGKHDAQLIRLLTCDLWAPISVFSAGMRLQPSVKWHRSARSMLVYRSLLSPCAGELDGSQIGNLMELCDTTASEYFFASWVW
jgi:hypothetical protein